jgi:hypothetical protein
MLMRLQKRTEQAAARIQAPESRSQVNQRAGSRIKSGMTEKKKTSSFQLSQPHLFNLFNLF